MEEAGLQGGQLELHFVGALPNSPDLSPEGTAEIRGKPDSHGFPSPGLTAWPGFVWSQRSDNRRHSLN